MQQPTRTASAEVPPSFRHAESRHIETDILAAVLPRDRGVVNATLASTEQALWEHFAPQRQAAPTSDARANAIAAVRCARAIREVGMSTAASLRTAFPEVKHKIDLPLLPSTVSFQF